VATKALSYAVIRNTAKHFNANKGNMCKAAEAAGLGKPTYYSRVKAARLRNIPTYSSISKSLPADSRSPKRSPRPWATRRFCTAPARRRAPARSKLKDAARIITDLEDRIKDLEWAAKASLEPSDWTLKRT
jgi:hypothetical protein